MIIINEDPHPMISFGEFLGRFYKGIECEFFEISFISIYIIYYIYYNIYNSIYSNKKYLL